MTPEPGAQSAAPDPFQGEEARIRAAYAQRAGDVRYSWFNPGHLFMVQERHGLATLESRRILEIGCGTGTWLLDFIKWGARPENIAGIDLLPDRIATATNLCPAGVVLVCGNAAGLEFADSTFDLVLQSTVFTSILDGTMRWRVASEMLRVLKPGGLILWYDYHVNNPRNLHVRAVNKSEILRLFPSTCVELHRITLAPPLTRWLAPRSWLACYLLGRLPWLCTHYLGAIRKAAE